MKETELETFKRVSGEANSFEIAKAYHVERKRIEGKNSFTCPFSEEKFIKDKKGEIEAWGVDNDRLDSSPSQCRWIAQSTSLAFFSNRKDAMKWNNKNFKLN